MKSEVEPQRTKAPVKVLFVCIGNSCRSQMAEAFANRLGRGQVRAWSAGSAPLGQIVPMTYDAMKEKGITLEGQWTKGLADVPVAEMDIVVGMGCEVDCPLPAGFKGRRIEWNTSDPYGEDAAYYGSVRDLIEGQVKALVEGLTDNSEAAPSA